MWYRAKSKVADLARFESAGRQGLFEAERISDLVAKIDALETKLSQPVLCAGSGLDGLPLKLDRLHPEDRVSFLFAVGNIDLLNSPVAGICGSRHASERGLGVASAAVKLLAQQQVVIASGYAAGVDMVAHLTALKEQSGTVIVLPEGLARFSVRKDLRPYWNWSQCLVLSQFSMSTPWRAWNAMRRNRTIMALSKLMLVVEAKLSGGTFDAGKVSLEYGVPVFAVDFAESDDMSAGNKALLDLGAQPLRKSRLTGEPSIENLIDLLNQ